MNFWYFGRKALHLNCLTDLCTYLGQRIQDKKVAFKLLYVHEWGFPADCSQHTGIAAANFSVVLNIYGMLKNECNYSSNKDVTELLICSFSNLYIPGTLRQEHLWWCCWAKSEFLFLCVVIHQMAFPSWLSPAVP